MRCSVLSLLCWALAPATSFAAPQAADPTNVVVLLADDLGYGDLSSFGAPLISTPRLDGMASDGARIEPFYVQPRCSPTRAALLTGSTPQRLGIYSALSQWSEYGMSSSELTVAEIMRGAGYRTGYFGKWHLGDSPSQLPGGQGFQDYLTTPWGHLAEPNAYVDSRASEWEWEPDARMSTARFTERTLEFISQAAADDVPFFTILSYSTPHLPAVASPAFDGISADGREYGDAVEELDHSVGQVLDRIDALGLAEDTLVIFLSDNGPAGGLNAYQAGSTGGLRGSKGTTFEGGVRVPFIARWSGTIPAGAIVDDIGADIDLAPTLLDVANIPVPPQVAYDGVSLLQPLTGGPALPPRPIFHAAGLQIDAVRLGDWKLRDGSLYDLSTDPAETTDLSAQFPSIAASLQADLDAHRADVAASLRPPEPRSTFIARWRGDGGLPGPSTLSDGDSWGAPQDPFPIWRIRDRDPAADLVVTGRVGPGPGDLTSQVIRSATPSPDLKLVRSGLPGEARLGCSIGMWTRSIEAVPQTPIVLLDVGDRLEGISVTVGDGGVIGDDPSPGIADDLRIRVRGSAGGQVTWLTVDLPSRWSTTLVNTTMTYDHDGDLVVYVDASEVARVPASSGPLMSLPLTDWTLFGKEGSLGAEEGGGPGAFPAVGCMGELGGVTIQSRPMFRQEVERDFCRHVKYSFCESTRNAAGLYADLDLQGRFHLPSEDLRVSVRNLPGQTFGFMIASRSQRRLPVASGYVCLDNPIFRISDQVAPSDSSGSVTYVFDQSLTPPAMDIQNTTFMNFQFWFRDGSASNFTNAVNVIFCP